MHWHIGYDGKVFLNGQYLGDVVDFQLKDSGKREDFSTGSRRDTREGKGRFDLISPRAERRRAKVLERGAVKYGERNWERGQPLGRYLDSALRHINSIKLGMKDEDHPAQAGWNMDAFMHTAELIEEGKLPRELDDIGYCTFPGSDATDERAEAEEEAYRAEESDVAGSPPFTVNNPCGSPGCVVCYPKEKEQSEAGPPATSSSRLNVLADQIRHYLQLPPRTTPVRWVFEEYLVHGYTAYEIFWAVHDVLHVKTVIKDGETCWRLPEEK